MCNMSHPCVWRDSSRWAHTAMQWILLWAPRRRRIWKPFSASPLPTLPTSSLQACCSVLHCITVSSCSDSNIVAQGMCCSVLQCVAVCCAVFQCLPVPTATLSKGICCSVLQCVAVCCSVSHCITVSSCSDSNIVAQGMCCSVLQCVAVCCSMSLFWLLQHHHSRHVAVCCSVLAVCCSVSLFRLLQHHDSRSCVAVCCAVLRCVTVCYSEF